MLSHDVDTCLITMDLMQEYINQVDLILCTSAYLPQPGLFTCAPALWLCQHFDETSGLPTSHSVVNDAQFRTLMGHSLLHNWEHTCESDRSLPLPAKMLHESKTSCGITWT